MSNTKDELLNKMAPHLSCSESPLGTLNLVVCLTGANGRYGKALRRLNELNTQLRDLKEFDNFWNSEWMWRRSVDNAISEIEYCLQQIGSNLGSALK